MTDETIAKEEKLDNDVELGGKEETEMLGNAESNRKNFKYASCLLLLLCVLGLAIGLPLNNREVSKIN